MTQRLLFRARFRAWQQFHAANPRVFELFVRFAREAVDAGCRKFGAREIGERIRWHVRIETRSADGWKLNNNHLPYYARLAMALHPELDGVFDCRDSRFDATTDEIVAAHSGMRSNDMTTLTESPVNRKMTVEIEAKGLPQAETYCANFEEIKDMVYAVRRPHLPEPYVRPSR